MDKKTKKIETRLAKDLMEFKETLYKTFENNNSVIQAIWDEIRTIINKIDLLNESICENNKNCVATSEIVQTLKESDVNHAQDITTIKFDIESLKLLNEKVNYLRNEVSSNQIHRIHTKDINLTIDYTKNRKRIAIGTENGFLKVYNSISGDKIIDIKSHESAI